MHRRLADQPHQAWVAEAIAWSAGVPARANIAELVVIPTGQG